VGGKRLGSYNDSGSFGELALMYNQPRAATIVATSPGGLWAMVVHIGSVTITTQQIRVHNNLPTTHYINLILTLILTLTLLLNSTQW